MPKPAIWQVCGALCLSLCLSACGAAAGLYLIQTPGSAPELLEASPTPSPEPSALMPDKR